MHSRKADVTDRNDDNLTRKKAVVNAVFNRRGPSRSPNRKSTERHRVSLGNEINVGSDVSSEFGNYYTVSGANADYLKDSISKSYHLQPVNEDERLGQTSLATSLSGSGGRLKKHNLFSRRDPKHDPSPPAPLQHNSPSSQSRHHSGPGGKQHGSGKVKNFIESFRHRTKSSTCDSPETHEGPVMYSRTPEILLNEGSRFTVTTAITASSSSRHPHPIRQLSATPNMEIGPDQYLEMRRNRTQSDTTKLLIARKEARDKFSHNRPSISGLKDSDDDDDDGETHYLVWRDKLKGTKVFRMPTSAHEYEEDDVFSSKPASYARLLKDHSCYDLMPPSSKIVVFDTKLTVKRAFLALVSNGVKAAVLWDTLIQDYTSMLTITDFIKILYRYHYTGEANIEDVENDTVSKWKSLFNSSSLISCCPEDSLLTALQLLCQNRVHRLLVVDKKLGNPVNILTHKRLLKFIYVHMKSIQEPSFMRSPVSSIHTATMKNVSTISYNTKLINVLKLFIEHRISAVPVVDEHKKLVDIFAKFDFSKLAYDKLYSDLGRPVREILNKQKSENSLNMHTCKPTDTIKSVVDRIVSASVHRLIIVNNNDEVIGVLSLSDLLRYLVLTPLDDQSKHSFDQEKLSSLLITESAVDVDDVDGGGGDNDDEFHSILDDDDNDVDDVMVKRIGGGGGDGGGGGGGGGGGDDGDQNMLF